jgi:release factor glutamine methyltransferase
MITIIELIRLSAEYFQKKAIETSRLDAELLLAHTLGVRRIDLYLNYDRPLQQEELRLFRALVSRRVHREPVAYITGVKEFWSLEFAVNPRVLIPRPETELLVEQTLKASEEVYRETGRPVSILEVGTGCGAVAVALARSLSHRAIITATDISPDALFVALGNAIRHGVKERVRFLCGNVLDPVEPGFLYHFIISNPPYIPSSLIPSLMPEVRQYEPIRSLDGGVNGLTVIRRVIREAAQRLMDGGRLLLEIGEGQQEPIRAILQETMAFEEPVFFQDLSGRDRVMGAALRRG